MVFDRRTGLLAAVFAASAISCSGEVGFSLSRNAQAEPRTQLVSRTDQCCTSEVVQDKLDFLVGKLVSGFEGGDTAVEFVTSTDFKRQLQGEHIKQLGIDYVRHGEREAESRIELDFSYTRGMTRYTFEPNAVDEMRSLLRTRKGRVRWYIRSRRPPSGFVEYHGRVQPGARTFRFGRVLEKDGVSIDASLHTPTWPEG